MLHKQQEEKLLRMSVSVKNKIDEETRKFHLLNTCLNEYREKLSEKSGQSISSIQYQQFFYFMEKLKVAIKQQSEIVKNYKEQHLKLLTEYELLKNKIKNIKKVVDKEIQIKQVKLERRETQDAIDLFNKLNLK